MVGLKQTLSNDNKNKIKIYINLQKEFISKYHPYKMAMGLLVQQDMTKICELQLICHDIVNVCIH